MTKPDLSSTFTLPLVAASDTIAAVLDRVRGLRAAAAIASDGNRFKVLSIEDLEQALGEDGEAQVGGVRGPEIVRVETARLAPLRLDLSDPAADAVNAALDGLNLDAAIVSLGSTAAGGRAATILGKFESDVMRAVRPVYQCPKGLETYSSPGTCGDHGVKLVRIR